VNGEEQKQNGLPKNANYPRTSTLSGYRVFSKSAPGLKGEILMSETKAGH